MKYENYLKALNDENYKCELLEKNGMTEEDFDNALKEFLAGFSTLADKSSLSLIV
jgi:hypothetical protein